MMKLNFLFDKKILPRLKQNRLTFPIYVSNENLENLMDLLLVTDGDNSHYVYTKDFDGFMFHKTKKKTKNAFAKVVYDVLVVKIC